MRTISTAQEDILNSVKYDVHLRVEIEDSTGGMQDLSAWVEGARWDWTLDQPVPQINVSMRRDDGSVDSLSPLDLASTYNLNSTGGWGPAIYPGRDIDVYTACTTPGGSPATSEYDWMFRGEIDEVQWERSPMQLIGRSKNMAALVDRWLESSTYLYGSSSGDLVGVVIRDVLADWTDLSTGILYEPTTAAFSVTPEYSPEKQSVMTAVTQLAQLTGWSLDEVFLSSSTTWVIQFAEPNRTATSSETSWTFGPNHYYDVRQMSVSRADVRNKVSVIYGPSTGRSQIIAQDTDSQDDYGLQWMELEEGTNSPINSSSEADTFANYALSDLKDPPAIHEIELPYWYPGQLNDYYQFEPNDIHYTSTQYWAVYGITHDLSPNRHRTSVRVRGKPASHVLGWYDYQGGGNQNLPEIGSIEIGFSKESYAIVSLSAASTTTENMYFTVAQGSSPSDPSTSDYQISGFTGSLESTVAVGAGQRAYVKAVAQNGAGIIGPVFSAQKDSASVLIAKSTVSGFFGYASLGSTDTEVYSVTIPGGIMGPNGEVSFRFLWNITSTGDESDCTCYVTLDGSTIATYTTSTSFFGKVSFDGTIANVASESAQQSWFTIVTAPVSPSGSTVVDVSLVTGTATAATTGDVSVGVHLLHGESSATMIKGLTQIALTLQLST